MQKGRRFAQPAWVGMWKLEMINPAQRGKSLLRLVRGLFA